MASGLVPKITNTFLNDIFIISDPVTDFYKELIYFNRAQNIFFVSETFLIIAFIHILKKI